MRRTSLKRWKGFAKKSVARERSSSTKPESSCRAYANIVILDFSRPGKPTDNAFIEAFNGRLRAECLCSPSALTGQFEVIVSEIVSGSS